MFNVFAINWYGESEFWLALSKMIIITGHIIYTFVTMLGGNPLHDRFGFRFWRDPGSFAEYDKPGSLGRFLTTSGPDYVSMAAGEAENPRAVMPMAYRQVFVRLMAFFVLGSLAVGINVAYNDPTLATALSSDTGGAGKPLRDRDDQA